MKTNVFNDRAQVILCDWCGAGGHIGESDTWDWLKAPEGDLCPSCIALARQRLELEAATATS